MARGLLDLANALDKRAKLTDELGNNLAKGLARELTRNLVEGTPVDTSQALSNWVVTLGSPSTTEIDPHFEGSKGSTYAQSGREAYKLAEIVLLKKKPGQKIYLVNNSDHIVELNQGSSAQAPAYFVQGIIARVLNAFRQKKGNGK